jgi:hypothetical protein
MACHGTPDAIKRLSGAISLDTLGRADGEHHRQGVLPFSAEPPVCLRCGIASLEAEEIRGLVGDRIGNLDQHVEEVRVYGSTECGREGAAIRRARLNLREEYLHWRGKLPDCVIGNTI